MTARRQSDDEVKHRNSADDCATVSLGPRSTIETLAMQPSVNWTIEKDNRALPV